MWLFVVPSSWIVAVTLLQFTELTLLVFCCSTQPVEGDGHGMNAAPKLVGFRVNAGATTISITTRHHRGCGRSGSGSWFYSHAVERATGQ